MAYTKTNWVNEGPPAISADNLNKIEDGIFNAAANIDAILTDLTITAPTVTVSTTTGTLLSATVYKYGKVVNLQISVYNSSATASGGNIFTGSITTSALRPKATATGASYYASHAIGLTIGTTGNITVRNASSTSVTTSSGAPVNISAMYLVD